MNSNFESIFDISVTRSDEELLELVTNMKSKKRQPTFAVVPIIAMTLVCVVAGGLMIYEPPRGGVAADASNPAQTKLMNGNEPISDEFYYFAEGETPQVGKYMHVSGDKNRYVEFFSDGTVQIFGFDYVEHYRSTFPTEHDYDDDYVTYCFDIAAADSMRIAQRTDYYMQGNSVVVNVHDPETETGLSGFAVYFSDDNTLAFFSGSNAYRYVG
ncbi:MAG: hypothetical protein FWG45_04795 [Oscillospiraceae bacterium]|nr:hypothetical protein [Oscillospiraceae bacterium]